MVAVQGPARKTPEPPCAPELAVMLAPGHACLLACHRGFGV